jgi:hypothetical protein
VTKPELLRKLEIMIDEAIRTEMWGKIELTFAKGSPHTLRKEITESLTGDGKGKPHQAAHANQLSR